MDQDLSNDPYPVEKFLQVAEKHKFDCHIGCHLAHQMTAHSGLKPV